MGVLAESGLEGGMHAAGMAVELQHAADVAGCVHRCTEQLCDSCTAASWQGVASEYTQTKGMASVLANRRHGFRTRKQGE